MIGVKDPWKSERDKKGECLGIKWCLRSVYYYNLKQQVIVIVFKSVFDMQNVKY